MAMFPSTPQPQDTPWGVPQIADQLLPGIWLVETASHGGLMLSAARQGAMPDALRREDCIYEEDCDWALPVLGFEAEFALAERTPAGWVQLAHDTARMWHPDAYMAFTGTTLTPSDSHVLQEREAYRERIGRIVVRSAYGSWADWVPKGKTGVVGATLEGVNHLAQPRYGAAAHRGLCDAAAYEARSRPVAFDELGVELLDESSTIVPAA